jgi:glycosyltransferase involved in cell wall biosynthesis
MKAFAVIPAYNEETRIGAVIRALAGAVDGVVVVDDGSSDGTAREAEAAGADVVRHFLNRGQGAALKTGTMAALERGADAVVHIDADGQHDPASLPAVLAPLEEGKADIVFGSRFLGVRSEGMPASRRLLLWAARQFSMLALGIPRRFTDPQSGLRAMRAEAARAIDFRQDRMAHCSEILRLASRSPYRSVEVPVRVIYTRETLAKGQKAADALAIVWQLFLGSLHR